MTVGPGAGVAEPCSNCDDPRGVFQPVGPHAGDLWALSPDALQLVEPTTGRMLTHIALPAADKPADVAVEPDGRYVDVSAWSVASSPGEAVVLELSTSSGALVKNLDVPFADSAPLLTAVSNGVWLSFRTGMTGMTERVDEGSLALTPSPYGAGPGVSEGAGMFAPPAPDVATMGGAWATSFGRVVVLADAEGASCVQATSARVLASAQFPASGAWAPFGLGPHPLRAAVGTFGSERGRCVRDPARRLRAGLIPSGACAATESAQASAGPGLGGSDLLSVGRCWLVAGRRPGQVRQKLSPGAR